MTNASYPGPRTPPTSPWQLDLDWLWQTPPGNDGSPATLQVDVFGPEAARAATAWLASLPLDNNGVRGRAGWRADPASQPDSVEHATLLLTSAGEDVADGLEAAADDIYQALAAGHGLTVRWTPLPRQ